MMLCNICNRKHRWRLVWPYVASFIANSYQGIDPMGDTAACWDVAYESVMCGKPVPWEWIAEHARRRRRFNWVQMAIYGRSFDMLEVWG